MAKEQYFVDLAQTNYIDYYKNILLVAHRLSLDPDNLYHKHTLEELAQMIKENYDTQVVGLSDPAEFANNPDHKYDQVVAAFVDGCGGRYGQWELVKDLSNPIALRSIVKTPIMKECLEKGRDFYYIDTGYFGNLGKAKLYHRITKNAMQYLGPIVDRPDDRFSATKVKLKSFKKNIGSKILLCPPSEKAMRNGWGLDIDTWMKETIDEIKKYSNRQIVVRHKAIRNERQLNNTIQEALANDIFCLVTYNSIAAVEALMEGKPVVALGPNAAHHFARSSLIDIENPLIPEPDALRRFFNHLAYHQFSKIEMRNGYAWNVLQGNA